MGKKQKSSNLDEILETEIVEQPIKVRPKRTLSFKAWFDKKVKEGKLRSYQDHALKVFFKKNGLKDIEDQNTYDETFKKF